jgi:hypothetical protein
MTVWLVYKNGKYWGSQCIVAICSTKELALRYAAKNRDISEAELYGYHAVAMEVLNDDTGIDHPETDLRQSSTKRKQEQGLLF